MKKTNWKIAKIALACSVLVALTMGQASPDGCDGQSTTGAQADTLRQQRIADEMQDAQKTPTDIRFSLERHNLIRRAYWVNGMREKAMALPCKVDKPLGYIVLVTGSGTVLGQFVVDGKLSNLRSWLTPQSEYYETSGGECYRRNMWLADVDGCYGDNSDGVFWFTPDGKYMEWTGTYLYSDIPFKVASPVLRVSNEGGIE